MSEYTYKAIVSETRGHDHYYGEKILRVLQARDDEYALILYRSEGALPTVSSVYLSAEEMRKLCETTLAHIAGEKKLLERDVVFPTPPTCPICGHNITVTTKDIPRPVNWSDKRNTVVGSIRVHCAYCDKGLVTSITYEDTITFSDVFQHAVHNFQVSMIKKDKE